MSISIKKNQVVIRIDENVEQKEIVSDLKKKILELKNLYKDDKTPILITGKVLKNREMDEIQSIIKKFIDVPIEFDSPKVLGFTKRLQLQKRSSIKDHLGQGRK